MEKEITLNLTDEAIELLKQSILKNYTYLNQYHETKEECSLLRDILNQLNNQ